LVQNSGLLAFTRVQTLTIIDPIRPWG
jgi:hypothetical protein